MSHNLCPCCQIPLSTLQHMGAHPMLCSVCRGLFFTEQDLISSFREAVALLKTSTTGEGHQRVCPQDQTVMTLRRVEGEGRPIELDHCGDCGGVWFDGDEVRQVPRDGVATAASDNIADKKEGKAAGVTHRESTKLPR